MSFKSAMKHCAIQFYCKNPTPCLCFDKNLICNLSLLALKMDNIA